MNSRLYFMAAVVFRITASQTFTLLVEDQSLTLRCTTVDLDAIIVLILGTDNRGGCLAGSLCATFIRGYETPTQDANITQMVITSCNKTRDIGNWTCTYGASTSAPFEITTCPGVATTEDPSTTQHDVTTERLLTTTNDSTTTIQQNTISIYIAALLSLIALFMIVSLIVLLVLCCTGRVTCILPHAFNKKNISKTSMQNSNDKHENRQSYKTGSENEYRIYKGDGRTTSYQLRSDNQVINESYSVDENGHQSKNKHVVTSDSSQSIRCYLPSPEHSIKNTDNPQSIRNYLPSTDYSIKSTKHPHSIRNYLPSTEYSIRNSKNPNTRDNRGYYDTNW